MSRCVSSAYMSHLLDWIFMRDVLCSGLYDGVDRCHYILIPSMHGYRRQADIRINRNLAVLASNRANGHAPTSDVS